MTTLENLLSMTNEELRNWLRNVINKTAEDAHHAEYQRRCEERRQNIENDFNAEWSKKHFKWFFKKCRQKRLLGEIELRYPGPVFWLIEDIIEQTLPKTTNEFFGQFIDIKEPADEHNN